MLYETTRKTLFLNYKCTRNPLGKLTKKPFYPTSKLENNHGNSPK